MINFHPLPQGLAVAALGCSLLSPFVSTLLVGMEVRACQRGQKPYIFWRQS